MNARRALACSLCFGLALASASCVEQGSAVDYGDPTAASTPTVVDDLVAYVVSPQTGASVTTPSAAVVVAAYSLDGQAVVVQMATADSDPRATTASGTKGPSQRFSAFLPLLSGENPIDVTIASADGAHFRKLEVIVPYQGNAPGIAFRVLAPAASDGSCSQTKELTDGVVSSTSVCVTGRASPGAAPLESVSLESTGQSAVTATLDENGVFTSPLTISANQAVHVLGKVTDISGLSTTSTVDVTSDMTPPTLTLTSPVTSTGTLAIDDASVTLTGTVSDANGIASLRMQTSTGGSSTLATTSPWTVMVPLAPGKNDISIVATDDAGNIATLPLTVVQNRVITLSAQKQNQGGTELMLDKNAMEMLLAPADQMTLIMASVPLRPSILAALHQIRDPESNNVDTSMWGSAEHNMNRLLNMTPDNADLDGTSVSELLGIAAAIGLPPARVLAQLLDITNTTTFVDLDTAADVITAQLVGTHPNITMDSTGQPTMDVSMYDVFNDLTTLAARFGPSGAHPGFLQGMTYSQVLQPGFSMSLPVKSNLTQYDGVDASSGGRTALFSANGMDVLALDFTSNDFSIVGLTDQPTVDLDIAITENPGFLAAGSDQMADPDPARPGFYRGSSDVWTIPPWQIESIIAETAYRENVEQFASSNYVRTLTYNAGSIMNAATIGWDKGWVSMMTAGGIGDPPMPQYAWDILSETAQVRLHDGGIPEGMANLGFALKGVSIGLTADQLIAKVKPQLQAQSSKLSSLIAGSAGLAQTTCDFYYVENDGMTGGFLFFRAPSDSTGTYDYAVTGFYADRELTQKISSTAALSGTSDTTHEKLVPTAGQVLYLADDTSTSYKIEIVSVTGTTVSLRVEGGA